MSLVSAYKQKQPSNLTVNHKVTITSFSPSLDKHILKVKHCIQNKAMHISMQEDAGQFILLKVPGVDDAYEHKRKNSIFPTERTRKEIR